MAIIKPNPKQLIIRIRATVDRWVYEVPTNAYDVVQTDSDWTFYINNFGTTYTMKVDRVRHTINKIKSDFAGEDSYWVLDISDDLVEKYQRPITLVGQKTKRAG